ncbi:MAG TPA: hypothetical protein DEO88_05355, partial [Syntrophobacteraceae bacterium]|nr:hypothetical protein [Syntrophobacteraceae bacterium]
MPQAGANWRPPEVEVTRPGLLICRTFDRMQDIHVQIEEMRGHMASSRTQPRIEQRNVLTAVVGNTPAVVTETLWALEQQRAIRVDEIRIITTAVGRDSIARYLLGPDGHFAKYCHDYGLAAGRIAFSAQ